MKGIERTPERVVWARKEASTTHCPRSVISGQSAAWVEEFVVRRRLGLRWPQEMGARETEAFLMLEAEWEAETQNG
jgi:hypothetical protein